MKGTKSWRVWSVGLLKAGVCVWFLCHFALTFFYVMPWNPVKVHLQPLLDVTIGTYFTQNWGLFAPNPVSSDDVLLVRCFSREEAETVTTKGLPDSGWHDLSTPLWEKFHANRFSAYDRLGRAQSGAARQYLSGGPDLEPWAESCRKGVEESCRIFEERLKFARADAALMLSKVGSSYCNEIHGPGSQTKVALRLQQTLAVPWSERYGGQRAEQVHELGIYPVDAGVAKVGLFKWEGVR